MPPSPFAPPTHGAAKGVGPPADPVVPPPPMPSAPVPAPAPAPSPAPAWTAPAVAPTSAGTLGVPGARTLDERSTLPGGVAAIVAAALVAIGVFLPWMEVGDQAVSGWRSSIDAKVLLGLVGVATLVGALIIGGARSLVLRFTLAVLGLATIAIGVIDVLSVDDLSGDVDHGVGLIPVLVGGLLLGVAALLTRHRRFR